MNHKCDYCDKIIEPNTTLDKVTCTCNIDPDKCEMSSNVTCENALCQLKLTNDLYKIELEKCKTDLAKYKALNNSFRILGFSPKSLELLISQSGFQIGNLRVNKNEKFTWDQMDTDTLISLGLEILTSYERLTKDWSTFLNEKGLKVKISKENVEKTNKLIKQSKDISEGKLNADGSAIKKETGAKLEPFEKIVFHNMKSMGMTLEQAIEFAHTMGAVGEVRPETKFKTN